MAGTPGFTEAALQAQLITTHSPTINFELSILDFSGFTAGCAVGDFDRDGFQDLFVICGGNDPDRLYINNGDGTFSNEADAWGVGLKHMGLGASVGDYNNDGWPDIYVTSLGLANEWPTINRHILYKNNGDGTFVDVAAEAGVRSTGGTPMFADGFSSAWGDYDLDGDLDLAVAGWLSIYETTKLFRNEGDGTFTDVTNVVNSQGKAVIDAPKWIRSYTPAFVDMDGDRYPELLLAADFKTSRYYQNNGDGTFTDVTEENGTGLDANGMGQSVGDLDGDGVLDWYVTSIHSEVPGTPGVPGTGNMLYMGLGTGAFLEESVARGVNDGGWGWGVAVIDLDHDMDLDIVETNGFGQQNPQGVNEWKDNPCYAYINDGAGFFTESGAGLGLTNKGMGRGLSLIDMENDGDLDVAICNFKDKFVFYRNDLSGEDTHWLRLFFDTTAHACLAPFGIGTRITATAGGVSQVNVIDSRATYLSNSEIGAHFGLGANGVIDELTIQFADGTVRTLTDVIADRTIHLNVFYPGDADGSGVVDSADLNLLLQRYGATGSAGFDPSDFDFDGQVGASDLGLLLANFGSSPSCPQPE